MTDKELVKQLIDRNAKLKEARSEWESLWDLAGQYVQAQTGSMLYGSERQSGEKRGIKVYDGTPESAKDIMVAGFYSGLCPDNYKWFRWSPVPIELSEVPEVKSWLTRCEDITYRVLNDSNYGDATFACFEWQVAFGTGIKYIESGDDKIINARIIDLIECTFVENRYGTVDTLFREYKLSARDAIKHFGADNVALEIRRADASGNKDDEFAFLHAVFPREDYDPMRRDRNNMPFSSVHIYPSTRKVMTEGGYRTFPYTVSRMYKQGKEPYGRGPGIKALSDMGVLNEMAATNLIAGQRMIEPSLQVPDDGYTRAIDLGAGALNFYNPGSGGEIKPIVTGLNVPFGLELQDRQERAVQRWFHVDIFLAITQADQRMTATEALERKQEKLQLIGPVTARQKREHLDADLDRIFSILWDNGYFPPPPDVVMQHMSELETEYTSPLFQAQMRRDAEGIMKIYSQAAMLAQATGRPDVLDGLDDDKALSILVDRENLPDGILRDAQEVAQIRQARQQQQQAMMQAQMAMSAVEAAKNLGQTPLDPASPNAATELLGMGGRS